MMHTKDEIDQFLRGAFFAVLTYPGAEGLISQLMIFSHSVDGEFYLVSQNEKSLFEPLSANPEVSILIYKEEVELDDIRQVNITGKATLINGYDSDDAKICFESVGEKSPIIGNTPFDEQNREYFSLIKVKANKISYITFGELKHHLAPTTLTRV
ncbi:MAG: pyridoxamine 5'-phosphate oxidase family protein [Spirochaetota bacterium]|nr:pyridoxamine 5'-phosphate oxidase family protein [Spirochaetota bacterium]